jgi:hypothetical protein
VLQLQKYRKKVKSNEDQLILKKIASAFLSYTLKEMFVLYYFQYIEQKSCYPSTFLLSSLYFFFCWLIIEGKILFFFRNSLAYKTEIWKTYKKGISFQSGKITFTIINLLISTLIFLDWSLSILSQIKWNNLIIFQIKWADLVWSHL